MIFDWPHPAPTLLDAWWFLPGFGPLARLEAVAFEAGAYGRSRMIAGKDVPVPKGYRDSVRPAEDSDTSI